MKSCSEKSEQLFYCCSFAQKTESTELKDVQSSESRVQIPPPINPPLNAVPIRIRKGYVPKKKKPL